MKYERRIFAVCFDINDKEIYRCSGADDKEVNFKIDLIRRFGRVDQKMRNKYRRIVRVETHSI